MNGKEWDGKRYNSECEIIYELKNGKGIIKEYSYYNKLIFIGEYLNGERNGYGTEYDYKGYLIFDGEYLNGKEWNGKRYNDKNEIVYELKNGKGILKEYFYGNLIYEGEYLNGERNGKGKEYNCKG